MVSFSALTVLSIAALFAGADAGALPKRQTESSVIPTPTPTPTPGSQNPFESIIKSIVAGFNISVNATGPFNVNATIGLGDQGTNQYSPLFQQLIPAVFDGVTGLTNNVSLTGVTGQPPFSIGLGFSPVNSTAASVFNFSTIFPHISYPFSSIISGFFNGSNITTFPISPGFPFGTNGSFPFPGRNTTFLGFNGTIPSFPRLNATGLSFPGHSNGTVTILPIPGFNPTVLPFPIPTSVLSSIEGELPSIVVSVSQDLRLAPSVSLPIIILPTDTSVVPPPTDVPTPTLVDPTLSPADPTLSV